VSLLPRSVAIQAAAARSGLGDSLQEMRERILAGQSGLRPLSGFLGEDSPWAYLPGAWLQDRKPIRRRLYGAASNLAVSIAREAAESAGWSAEMLAEAWIFAGTSRGNTCELLRHHHQRRPHRIYAASNSMHSEVAAAVSIELGIRGPWQLLSNGCASGLDAAGMAAFAISSGMAPRALAISVELPLLPELLEDFQLTGLLSTNAVNDPYGERTSGFLPAEAAAALALAPQTTDPKAVSITGCWWNSDAHDPVGLPADGAPLRELIQQALTAHDSHKAVAVCPHATGTKAHCQVEAQALAAVLPTGSSVHLLKPYTGHTLGASGALDLAILWSFLREGQLPPNLPSITAGTNGLHLPKQLTPCTSDVVLKISAGMGGHNALLSLAPAH
jgi:3-oxoacyl-[acyl-carrier-protein] synthase II